MDSFDVAWQFSIMIAATAAMMFLVWRIEKKVKHEEGEVI